MTSTMDRRLADCNEDERRDPPAAGTARSGERGDPRPGQRPQARAGTPSAQGARWVRRAAARNLLRDHAAAGLVPAQYSFKTGERVDAVIRVERLLPIDAKFPLDNFERLADAETDERVLHEKAFARDLRNHVDAIATKYIRPDEGVRLRADVPPVRGVYYELVCGKTGNAQVRSRSASSPCLPTTLTRTSRWSRRAFGDADREARARRHGVLSPRSARTSTASAATSRSSASTSRTPRRSTRTPRSGWIGSTRARARAETEEAEVQMAEELPRALDAA